MKIELSYNLASLHMAAAFIWDNNPMVKQWLSAPTSEYDVLELIRDDMMRYAAANARAILKERETKTYRPDSWTSYTGTGGYYLTYELQSDEDEEDIVIGVDILVDPGVGSPEPRYMTEVIDNDEQSA